MPPKIVFTKIDDDIIREIFCLREQNNWSNAEMERQFRQRSSKSISYKTLSARFNYNNIKSEVISENSLSQQITIFDQPENTVDITSKIEHSLSILKVDESNSNTDNSDEVISSHNSDQTNFTNSETARVRPRGRPVGSRNKKKKTPLTLETELRRIKVNQLKIRQARVNRQLSHRENLIPLTAENTRTRREDGTPDETLNHVSMEAQRQRERRANETIEQTNDRHERDAQRQRERRANETIEQTNDRHERDAQRQRERRANETIEQTNDRHERDAQRQRERRANETPKENERRLRQQREYRVRTRKKKTEERLNRK